MTIKHDERKPSKKTILEKEVISELKAGNPYFSYEEIRNAFEDKTGEAISNATLKSYLSKFKKQGILFDAGKGWYSSLKEPLVLDEEPLHSITSFLNENFPLLETACWSTQQINPFMHHLLSKFTTFVYTPSDAMDVVADALRDRGYSVLINPGKMEIIKQYPSLDAPIIIRPFSDEEKSTIQKNTRQEWLFINFLIENKKFSITEEEEAQTAVNTAVTSGHVNMARFLSYAKRKRIKTGIINYLHKNKKCGDS